MQQYYKDKRRRTLEEISLWLLIMGYIGMIVFVAVAVGKLLKS
jgi:hypothetical protein